MKRRKPERRRDPVAVPAALAAGPCVDVWADPEIRALLTPGSPGERLETRAREDVQLCGSVERLVEMDAERRWRKALKSWSVDNGVSTAELATLMRCPLSAYAGDPVVPAVGAATWAERYRWMRASQIGHP